MKETVKAIMERRSIRKYSGRQIPRELLEEILAAACCSPNAGNRQTTQIVVCRSAEINEKMGGINWSAFAGRVSAAHKVSEEQPSIADTAEIQSAFYNAPTVITLFAPRQFLYAAPDSWIMANNMALAAHALGLGSCLVGRAEASFSGVWGQELKEKWGIPEQMDAQVHLAMGYPQGDYPKAKPRRFPTPIWVE